MLTGPPATSLVLYVYPPSPRSVKVLLTAEYLGLDYELRLIDLTRGEQKSPTYVAVNPNGRTPALAAGDYRLWESNAIIEFLADTFDGGLLPPIGPDRYAITKWLYWDSAHWDPAVTILAFEYAAKPILGLGPPDPEAVARGHTLLARLAPVLDAQLATSTFLSGERITAADLALAAPLMCVAEAELSLTGYGQLASWFQQIAALPAWQRVCAMREEVLARQRSLGD